MLPHREATTKKAIIYLNLLPPYLSGRNGEKSHELSNSITCLWAEISVYDIGSKKQEYLTFICNTVHLLGRTHKNC
jgi:hypothetical protein